jgi:hypothetical protein
MVFDRFAPDGVPLVKADWCPAWQKLRYPVRGRFFSAGFAFTLGRFCTDVPYDPALYFLGEEITMAVRAFTHGYDLFHPHRTVCWHYYGRPNRRKHWDDHTAWYVQNDASMRRVRQLLGMAPRNAKEAFGKYGLGQMRSLRDYERYAGISFSRRTALR